MTDGAKPLSVVELIAHHDAAPATDGFASRTAVITAQQGNADRQTPIATG
jgi:hypothetical protein